MGDEKLAELCFASDLILVQNQLRKTSVKKSRQINGLAALQGSAYREGRQAEIPALSIAPGGDNLSGL